MTELNKSAKIAILRVLKDIVKADNRIHDKEIEYIGQVAKSFELDADCLPEVDSMVTLQALAIIRELPSENKTKIAKLMGNMIVIDEDINYKEVKLYNAVCESCNIEKDFHINDYQDCTISGPFANPEDLVNNI